MGTAVRTAPELHLALRHTIYIAYIICYHCVPPEEVAGYDSGDAASTDQVPCMALQPTVHDTIALKPASYMKIPLPSTLL